MRAQQAGTGGDAGKGLSLIAVAGGGMERVRQTTAKLPLEFLREQWDARSLSEKKVVQSP